MPIESLFFHVRGLTHLTPSHHPSLPPGYPEGHISAKSIDEDIQVRLRAVPLSIE